MAKTEREIFAENLRSYIEKSHLNQSRIAERIGVSRGTMSDYVRGTAYPRPEKLAQLCEALGVSQYDLTGAEQHSSIPNREVLRIAEEIQSDPEARQLYDQIRRLKSDEREMIRNLIKKLAD